MLHIINGKDIAEHEDLVADMFRMRFRVTKNELKWALPNARAGYDIDEFDTPDTIYLINEKRGKVAACARLNPTDKPHLMSELFADFCDLHPYPQSPNVMELSRFLIEKQDIDFQTFRRRQAELVLGLNELCLSLGLTGMSWLTYLRNYTEASTFWKIRPLGLPKKSPDDRGRYIAALSEISPQGLANARKWAGEIDLNLIKSPILSPNMPVADYV